MTTAGVLATTRAARVRRRRRLARLGTDLRAVPRWPAPEQERAAGVRR
ncbi:hypothetical protein CLV35_0892 [Motilibacter peucedani]|uniref:Uncharacterized protein n=1 Tax=Motilibacter peucedani TaxID=598650 RepID=A0A420XUN8_9ACTN|nr:hypothetical protein [Motilibacter peucedani]RKS80460.1 hypothetical protein CLV35_0892 [Motilibacter peucedani]